MSILVTNNLKGTFNYSTYEIKNTIKESVKIEMAKDWSIYKPKAWWVTWIGTGGRTNVKSTGW